MNFNNMKKHELVNLCIRRFLFNDTVPVEDSGDMNDLVFDINRDYTVKELISKLEDMSKIFFEVVSHEKRSYPNVIIRKPYHGSKHSAGIDIYLPVSVSLPKGHSIIVASDISYRFPEDMVCLGNIRSSVGIKQNITLSNSQIILDSDYFDADNEGNINISLINNSDKMQHLKGSSDDDIKQGRVIQLILTPFYLPEEYRSSDTRTGGLGSSDKGDE